MRRVATVAFGIVGLLGGLAAPAAADIAAVPEDPEVRIGVPDEPDRLAGGTRIETAAQIARYASRMHPAPDRVYLARSDGFVDALAAGTLRDGPILFVPRSGPTPDAVRAAIDDLDPAEVVALGGPQAVPEAALVAAADGRDTDRIAGGDRYATATQIARRAWEGRTPRVVYVARADVPVDALAGGFLTDGPVLLLPRSGPAPEVVRQTIADLDPTQVIRLGGDQAIHPLTVLHAAGEGRSWGSVDGPDRYTTAAEISRRVVKDDMPTRTIYLARADVFADAVVAGALPDGMLLLADSCGDLPAPTAERLASVQARNVVALGGATALCDQTLQAARAGMPDLVLSGSDRDDDRRCPNADGEPMACTDQTLGGEVLEAWVEDARQDDDSLAIVVRLPSLHDLPDGAPTASIPRFSFEDPDSQAAIRFEVTGAFFDVEVRRPDGSTDDEARSKYVGDCHLGGTVGGGVDAFSTLRKEVGADPGCFSEVDWDTWRLTVEVTVGDDQQAATDRLTLVP